MNLHPEDYFVQHYLLAKDKPVESANAASEEDIAEHMKRLWEKLSPI